MPAKQLKMSLLQDFSEMTTQRNGLRENFVLVISRHVCLAAVSAQEFSLNPLLWVVN